MEGRPTTRALSDSRDLRGHFISPALQFVTTVGGGVDPRQRWAAVVIRETLAVRFAHAKRSALDDASGMFCAL